MLYPVAAFDLDGTLVDTAPDLISALNAVLAAADLTPVPEDRARGMIGRGAKAMIEDGLQHHGVRLESARVEAMHLHFLEHYGAHIADTSRPFPGLEQALDRLEADGFRLAVCTNKLEDLSRLLLGRLGLAGRFRAIVGVDTLGVRKPDPRHLTGTIEAAGGDPARSVMVGDSRLDVAAAKGAGIPVIAVSFGYGEAPPRELGADHVIDHYDELAEAVRRLTGAAAGSPVA